MLSPGLVNDLSLNGWCLSLFVPLIIILDIKDQNEKVRFLDGESNLLESLSKEIEAIHFMLCRLDGSGNDENEKFDIGFERIKAIYNYTFNGNSITYRISSYGRE